MVRASVVLSLLLCVSACHERHDDAADPVDPTLGDMPAPLHVTPSHDLSGPRTETPGVEVIYLVSLDGQLLAYDPVTSAVQRVGAIHCPTSSDGDSPRSASVDRHGRAWVLYRSGDVFWVDTDTAACHRSTWQPGRGGWEWFGMGFVRDPDGGEGLYISGTGGSPRDGQLGRIDPDTATVTAIGDLPPGEQNAELAGGDAASLYAYYPGTSLSYVAQIDRTSGKALATWETPTLGGLVYAWAAASLGGHVYLFASFEDPDGGAHSKVLRFEPASGKTTIARDETPYAIVGAGVGTRAPVVVR